MQLAGKAGHWWVSPTSLPHAVGGGTSAPKRGGNQRQGGGGVSREPPPTPPPPARPCGIAHSRRRCGPGSCREGGCGVAVGRERLAVGRRERRWGDRWCGGGGEGRRQPPPIPPHSDRPNNGRPLGEVGERGGSPRGKGGGTRRRGGGENTWERGAKAGSAASARGVRWARAVGGERRRGGGSDDGETAAARAQRPSGERTRRRAAARGVLHRR